MQTPSLGRRFRARFVAVAVAGALMISMIPATASAIPIDPYVAVAVNIINLPASAGVNQNFGFQVEAVDAFGFRDWDYGGPMALLTVSGSPDCAMTMIGIIFTDGVATVSNMTCGTPGTVTIFADTADLLPDTAQIQITSNQRLAFGSYPASVTPSLLSPQPTVELRDAFGFLVTSPLQQITVNLTVSPATVSFTCSGGTQRQTIGGIASFSGCTLPAGTGYQLTASPAFFSDATPVTGPSFNVVGRKLAFTQQPGGANAVPTQALPIQPIVAVQDASGVVQTLQNNGTVTLTIATGPVGATLTCTNGNVRNVVNGYATFQGCAVSAQGTNYSLTATYTPTLVGEPTTQPATSQVFTVNATPAQIILSSSATVVNSGQGFTLSAQFASGGANQTITFQKKAANDVDWQSIGQVTTNSSGLGSLLTVPTYTAQYRATFAGGAGLSAGTSNVLSVSARFSSGVLTPNYTGTKTLSKGTRVTYSVTSRPLGVNGVVPTVTFQIYKSVNGVWEFQTSATVPSNSSGVATFSWTWSKSGTWYMRGRINATAYNTALFTNLAKVKIN